MAIAITTRPAVWVAVKNPVVYKFTTTSGPFVNYRIEVEVFKSSDNTSLTNGTKFAFTPNAAGITFVDISSIVKAYLKAEWTNPVTLNTVETDTGLEVYIKYQELYDGSATSVIDDIANPVHCVFAALQIPSATGGDMQKYVPSDATSKFLTMFDRPKLWRGYPATLSFIFPDAISLWLIRSQFTGEAISFLGVFDSTGYALIFYYAHGLSDGDTVYINSNVEDYNGDWVINVLSVNSFLILSAAGAPVAFAGNASGTFAQTIAEILELNAANDDHVNRLFINHASWLLATTKTITLKLKAYAVDADALGDEVLVNETFTATMDPWTNEAGAGTDWDWFSDRVRFNAGLTTGQSDPLEQTFAEQPAGLYQMEYDITLTDNTDQLTFIVQVFNASVLVQEILNVLLPINITSLNGFASDVNILAPFDQIKIIVDNTPAASSVFGLSRFSLKALTPEILSNHEFANVLAPWTNEAGAGFNWAWAAGNKAHVTITSGVGYSDYLVQDIVTQAAGIYIIQMNIINNSAIQSTLSVEVWNDGVLVEEILSIPHPANTVAATTWTYPVSVSAIFDEIKIKASYSPIGIRGFEITNFSMKPATETVFSEVLTLDVVDPCENPVMLEWKNSIGGDSWWLFDHNQEASYNYSGSKKAKRMSLSVNNLTVNQWEALNEIFTLGEVYRNNIVEFTALVDKTAVRNDAQVYVVNADGSKTGVIVLPTNNILFTRQKRHTFHIEIEFPEVQ